MRSTLLSLAALALASGCLAAKDGVDGASCSVTQHEDGSATIQCADGTAATVRPGASGAAGEAARMDPEPAGENCPAGGVRLQTQDGQTRYACNGLGAPVAPPIILPAGGRFDDRVLVSLAPGEQGAALYYTLDGTTPTTAAARYTGPFTLGASARVRAIGFIPGRAQTVAEAAFTVVTTLRVSTAGSDVTGDGTAGAPFGSLPRAAQAAMQLPPETEVEIRVAGGQYELREPVSIGHRVMLLGGYDGRDWKARDVASHPVTLIDAGLSRTTGGFRALVAITEGPTESAGLDGFFLVPQTPAGAPVACVVSAGSPVIRNNRCTLHANGNLGVGLSHTGGAPLIEGNLLRLDAGPSPNGTLMGLALRESAPRIRRNDVRFTAPYGRYQQGIVVADVPRAASAIIAHNMVDTGAQLSWSGNSGIEAWGAGASVVIANNTVRFGNGPAHLAFGIGGPLQGPGESAALTIENNLVFSSFNQSNVVCIKSAGLPVSLKHNNLFRCSGGLTSGEAGLAGVNALPGAEGNVSFDLVGANSWFVNDASDFRLRAGGGAEFAAVKTGGRDLGLSFSLDRDGVARTGTSGFGWSMGAYEQDL